MPPRFTYWTIILENQPTAFRARTQEELAPTLRQLQSRHPDARMMWFARGRLWESPEAAREALQRKRAALRERRGPGWRPGGQHEDPRERFKVPRDEKRRRFAQKLNRERGEGQGSGGGSRGPGGRGPASRGPGGRGPGHRTFGGGRRGPGGRPRGGGNRGGGGRGGGSSR
jgi:hypothetical protein